MLMLFGPRNVTLVPGGLEEPQKIVSRLAIARHINFRPLVNYAIIRPLVRRRK